MELEDIISKLNNKHINYKEKDFIKMNMKSRVFKKIFKGLSIITLFSICAFGINKNSSIKNTSSNIFEKVNNYYHSLGINPNYSDVATFGTFALPLYLLVRRKN